MRGGVYYEAGFAHGLKSYSRVLYLPRDDTLVRTSRMMLTRVQ